MISSQPPPPPPGPGEPARSAYVPGLRLSAAGGATLTTTLFVSSSRVNARLSGETGGQPVGDVTAVLVTAAPRARFVTVSVNRRGSSALPSMGQSSSSGATATPTSRVTKAPGAPVGVPSSSRSAVQPLGAKTARLSARTVLSPAFQTETST